MSRSTSRTTRAPPAAPSPALPGGGAGALGAALMRLALGRWSPVAGGIWNGAGAAPGGAPDPAASLVIRL